MNIKFLSSAKSPSPYPFIVQADAICLEKVGYFQNVFIKKLILEINDGLDLDGMAGEFPEMYKECFF